MLAQLELLLCPTHMCYEPSSGKTMATTTSCPIGSSLISGHAPIWPYYCDGKAGYVEQTIGRLIVGWVPSLLITLWQGMLLTRLVFSLVQATGQCMSLSEVDRCIANW